MNPTLQNKLIKKYKQLFKQIDDSKSPMSYGIQCGDGWYDLIDCLCETIWTHVKLEKKTKEQFCVPEIVQIKQKFGNLRVYVSNGNTYVSSVIDLVERISERICEQCGRSRARKRSSPFNYKTTLCQECKKTIDEKIKLAGSIQQLPLEFYDFWKL